jgi:hypothetical protein
MTLQPLTGKAVRSAIQRKRRWLAFVLAIVVVGLAALSPALPRWAASRQEYPPGVIGKFRCFRDCLWLGYGGYHPTVDRIKLAAGNLLDVNVNPVRLDQRSSAGMGECASIGENRQGTVLAAWMMRDDRDGQTYKIYGRRLRTDGSPLGPDFRINTGLSSDVLAHHVSLRVDSQGWFYVLWHAAQTTGQLVRGGAGVFVRIFNPDGLPAAPEVLVSPENRGEMPELAVGANGIAAAVWSDRGQVWGRLLTHTGPYGAASCLDDTPAGALAEFPAAAFGTDGNLMAAWADTRTGGRDVYARILGPDLRPRRPSIRAGDGPVPKAFFRLISVAGTSAGYAVVWMKPGMQCGRWFGSNGNILGDVSAVLPAIAGVATLPQPDGSVLVSNGPSIRVWRLDRRGSGNNVSGLQRPKVLLPAPSRPCEINLAPSHQGIWIAWHDLIDARRIPALGDNFFIMAARVSLRR